MITLRMVDTDYYDEDTDEFVLTVGASVTALQTNVKIKDFDGAVLECYLTGLTFVPAEKRGRRDVYIARYKVF